MKNQPSQLKIQSKIHRLYQLARMKTGPRMTKNLNRMTKNLKSVTAAYAKNAIPRRMSRTGMAIF